MRTRQGYGAAIAAIMAATAATQGKEATVESLPIAAHSAPKWKDGGRTRRAQVPNKTSRGVRRAQTRGRPLR